MIIGIDLGTTNSLCAVVKNGEPQVLPSRSGGRLVPSVVAMKASRPVVGVSAKAAQVRDARHTAFSVKRLLGRSYSDLQESLASLPYEVVPGENDGPVRVRLGDQTFSAVEISAMILRELKLNAEEALGEEVRQAVITVPAYFNDAQRQATRLAGRLAGLDVLRMINEPTAASLAYGLDRKKNGLIAVYDLGGGTFDVSLLRLQDGIFEVLATQGNTALGGDDLDQIFIDEAVQDLQKKGLGSRLESPEVRAALREEAERVKIALSSDSQVQFSIQLLELSYQRVWTLAEFEARAEKVLALTRQPCLAALEDAGLKPQDLSDVILVGGPTRLKCVQKMAASIFGREPNTSVHPDEVVACGAAIQADILAGNNSELLLLDVVPLSLGIETYGDLMAPLIRRNTKIPATAREFFTNFVERQTAVDLHVLQGERDKASQNRSLARFKLRGLEQLPAGSHRIEVSFLIDADGVLQVSARDMRTGNLQAIEVKPSFGLSEEEVNRLLAESSTAASEDLAHRQLVEARNEAEPVLRGTEKHLSAAQKLLSPEEYTQVHEAWQALKAALAGTDSLKITDARYKLSAVTNRLAELVVQGALSEVTQDPPSGTHPTDQSK
jgi:molecular chaperone DnaK